MPQRPMQTHTHTGRRGRVIQPPPTPLPSFWAPSLAFSLLPDLLFPLPGPMDRLDWRVNEYVPDVS